MGLRKRRLLMLQGGSEKFRDVVENVVSVELSRLIGQFTHVIITIYILLVT